MDKMEEFFDKRLNELFKEFAILQAVKIMARAWDQVSQNTLKNAWNPLFVIILLATKVKVVKSKLKKKKSWKNTVKNIE